MKLARSSLFVPGNKRKWIRKALDYGADMLVLDLEDSVPNRDKIEAREIVRQELAFLKQNGQDCCVRINGFASTMTMKDLESIICPELESVVLPKVETIHDMQNLNALLTYLERGCQMEVGTVKTPLCLETAKAMYRAYDMATSCSRVTGIDLAAGPGGDAARSVGYLWTKDGRETLYLRSRIVLEARAAGIPYPRVSSWFDIKDLKGLEQDARLNRQIGFRGQTVIHPSHVPVVNKVFTPTADELERCKGILKAIEEAENEGTAAAVYDGDMIDYAMATTAKELLEFAESLGLKV